MEDYLNTVNCGDIYDDLDSSFGEKSFNAKCQLAQTHLMAVAASALQRIAASLERIEDLGIPGQ